MPLGITWFPSQDPQSYSPPSDIEIIARAVLGGACGTALGYHLLPKTSGQVNLKACPADFKLFEKLGALPGLKKVLALIAELPPQKQYQLRVAAILSPLILGGIALATDGVLFKIEYEKPF